MIAAVDEALEDRIARVTAGCGNQRTAGTDMGIEFAAKSLEAACDIAGIADCREGEKALAADGAEDHGTILHADADIDRGLALPFALRIPGVDATALMQSYRRHVVEAMHQYTRLKEDTSENDISLLLVADAEIYRLDSVIRWLDAAESRIRRLPAPSERVASPAPVVARRRVGARR